MKSSYNGLRVFYTFSQVSYENGQLLTWDTHPKSSSPAALPLCQSWSTPSEARISSSGTVGRLYHQDVRSCWIAPGELPAGSARTLRHSSWMTSPRPLAALYVHCPWSKYSGYSDIHKSRFSFQCELPGVPPMPSMGINIYKHIHLTRDMITFVDYHHTSRTGGASRTSREERNPC
jgi:hypothetical protein